VTEREAYITMNMIDGLGPVKARALLDVFGRPSAILQAEATALMKARGVGEDLARTIVEQRAAYRPEEEEARAAEKGIRLITPLDPEYPELLKAIHDPPLALYVMGSLLPRDKHAIALVGSRRCTHYGLSVADRLAYQLARVGFTVVSGLARGIDTAGHKGALKGEGRTLAVIGSALDCIYPPESEELARQIADHGAVLSEYSLGRPPDRTTFPYRNRIISGISMGVVVVEAGFKSGALHTSDAALDQGRSVFAVPGRIDAPSAQGCHQLIKNGARLVTDVNDILDEFDMLLPAEHKRKAAESGARPPIPLNAEEEAITRALLEGELDVDALARKAGLKSAQVSALLIGLEMKRVIRMLPGRMVELTVVPERPAGD
jgi:DNA processing protein